MKMNKILLCFYLLSYMQTGVAQDDQVSSSALPVPALSSPAAQEHANVITPQGNSSRPIEQIDVTGNRSFFRIRQQIIAAENDIYALFNDLNTSDGMDIVCKRVRPTMSHISVRVCEPEFVTTLRANNVGDALLGIDILFSDMAIKNESAASMEKIFQEYERIALENPDFARALVRFANLEAELAEKKK